MSSSSAKTFRISPTRPSSSEKVSKYRSKTSAHRCSHHSFHRAIHLKALKVLEKSDKVLEFNRITRNTPRHPNWDLVSTPSRNFGHSGFSRTTICLSERGPERLSGSPHSGSSTSQLCNTLSSATRRLPRRRPIAVEEGGGELKVPSTPFYGSC